MAVRPGRGPARSEASLFADRLGQSAVLRASLDAVEARLRRPAFDDPLLRNVLCFHGDGGVGKTTLSRRLETWVGDPAAAPPDGWGVSPHEGAVRTARWDVSGLGGGAFDVAGALVALRAGIAARRQQWPAFTLAMTAYWTATHPNEPLPTVRSTDQTGEVIGVLAAIAGDLGAADIVTSLGAAGIRSVSRIVIEKYRRHRQLQRIESLADVLARCESLAVGESDPELAADILWVLTEEVEALDPDARPLTAVFIDHFEKVQAHDALGAERAINAFIASTPWALFVITGRNRLDWDRVRDGLVVSGADWPLLGQTEEEPRQHLLGNLGEEDCLALLSARAHADGWPLDPATADDVLAEVAQSTDGWPLHIDAVCNVAALRTRELAGTGERLTADRLIGELPDLVRRFYEHFTEEEANVFNAACLLPFFDLPLVAAVAQTTTGAVERALSRTAIGYTEGDPYPYRVHEHLRRLVRNAGASVKGGWAEDDWREAAVRCVAEIGRRHADAEARAREIEESGGTRMDTEILDTLALGLTVAAAEDAYEPWLRDAVRTAPTVRGLSARLPALPGGRFDSDGWSIIGLFTIEGVVGV